MKKIIKLIRLYKYKKTKIMLFILKDNKTYNTQ